MSTLKTNESTSSGLNFEEIWYFEAGPLSTSNPSQQTHLSLGSWYVSPVALTSNLVPWWCGFWGFAALRMIIGFGTVFSCRIFFEKQASWNLCDYQDELLQRFRKKTSREWFLLGWCVPLSCCNHRSYLPTYRQLIYRRYYIIILAKSRIQHIWGAFQWQHRRKVKPHLLLTFQWRLPGNWWTKSIEPVRVLVEMP